MATLPKPPFEPIGERVLVQRIELPPTSGMIHIPDAAKERPQEGIVVGRGLGVNCINIVEGCRVLFGKYAGTEVTVDGATYLVLREDEILGRFTA